MTGNMNFNSKGQPANLVGKEFDAAVSRCYRTFTRFVKREIKDSDAQKVLAPVFKDCGVTFTHADLITLVAFYTKGKTEKDTKEKVINVSFESQFRRLFLNGGRELDAIRAARVDAHPTERKEKPKAPTKAEVIKENNALKEQVAQLLKELGRTTK